MPTSAAVVTGLLPTSGTVDFTQSGFGTPDAALVFVSNANSTDNPADDAKLSWGLWTASAVGSASVAANHNVATTDTTRAFSATNLLDIIDASGAGGTVRITYSATAITDGLRFAIAAGSDTVQRRCTVLLFKGVLNAYIGTVGLGTGTSAIDVTAPGFKPDLLFLLTHGGPTASGAGQHAIVSFGVARNSSTDVVSQGAVYYGSRDGMSTSIVNTRVTGSYAAGQLFNDALSWQASVSDFDASGFSITPTANASSDQVRYLALDLADPDDAYVNVVDSKTTTGTQAYAGAGFTPLALGLMATRATAVDTTLSSGSGALAYGLAGSSVSTGFAYWDKDGVATTVSRSEASTADVLLLTDEDGTDDTVAALSSFDADGWTLNYSVGSATARKMLAFAIGDSTAGGGAPTLSDLQATSITATTVQGTYDYAF